MTLLDRLARLVDPGPWWDRGPSAYVSMLSDPREKNQRMEDAYRKAQEIINLIHETVKDGDQSLWPSFEKGFERAGLESRLPISDSMLMRELKSRNLLENLANPLISDLHDVTYDDVLQREIDVLFGDVKTS